MLFISLSICTDIYLFIDQNSWKWSIYLIIGLISYHLSIYLDIYLFMDILHLLQVVEITIIYLSICGNIYQIIDRIRWHLSIICLSIGLDIYLFSDSLHLLKVNKIKFMYLSIIYI